MSGGGGGGGGCLIRIEEGFFVRGGAYIFSEDDGINSP